MEPERFELSKWIAGSFSSFSVQCLSALILLMLEFGARAVTWKKSISRLLSSYSRDVESSRCTKLKLPQFITCVTDGACGQPRKSRHDLC